MTTPSPFAADDEATRIRAIHDSIAAKQVQRPKVDAQGQPIEPVRAYNYDTHGRLIGPADTAGRQ